MSAVSEMDFPVFGRAYAGQALEFLLEYIRVFIADPFRNFIYLQVCGLKQLLCLFNPDFFQIGVEAVSGNLRKKPSEIRAVISEQTGKQIQGNPGGITGIYIVYAR